MKLEIVQPYPCGAAQAGDDEVLMWGSWKPRREFLHVDDVALFVLDLDHETYAANTDPMLSHINVVTGTDVSIMELAQMVAKVTGFEGRITNDPSKPDGTLRKLMDVSCLADMGLRALVNLESGPRETYDWFIENQNSLRH